MSYKSEFPDYDRELIIPEGFKDESWHNDMMPHVAKELKNGANICIWQDYKNPDLSECVYGHQFVFQIWIENGTCNDIVLDYPTDEWSEIEKLIKALQ